jgi:hypothetical protein
MDVSEEYVASPAGLTSVRLGRQLERESTYVLETTGLGAILDKEEQRAGPPPGSLTWRDRHQVWEALRHLEAETVLEALSHLPPETLEEIGLAPVLRRAGLLAGDQPAVKGRRHRSPAGGIGR